MEEKIDQYLLESAYRDYCLSQKYHYEEIVEFDDFVTRYSER